MDILKRETPPLRELLTPANQALSRIVVICQARTRSSRLPGKVLMEVLGKSLLEYEIERLKLVEAADALVIATTSHPTDDPIVRLCAQLDVGCFRGDEFDVLGRYHSTASEAGADVIVRVTADCPLIDPGIIDSAVGEYSRGRFDWLAASPESGFPRGLEAEVLSFEALAAAHRESTDPREREHVTPFLYTRPDRFRIGRLEAGQDLSQHRWTVDTADDFQLIDRILSTLYPLNPTFSWLDVLRLVEANPAWSLGNAHVRQKLWQDP